MLCQLHTNNVLPICYLLIIAMFLYLAILVEMSFVLCCSVQFFFFEVHGPWKIIKYLERMAVPENQKPSLPE